MMARLLFSQVTSGSFATAAEVIAEGDEPMPIVKLTVIDA